MTDLNSTTTVRVELTGRRATIADIQDALDTLTREGIPHTFDISIHQEQGREHEDGVAFEDRKVTHSLVIEAERAAAAGMSREVRDALRAGR